MSCIFCDIVAERAPASVVASDDRFVALLDIHPMRPGHTLVVPRRHVVHVAELGEAANALLAFAARVAPAVRAGVGGDDYHLVLNDGPAANQTIPHAHVHIIPRWRGDLARLLARLLVRPIQPLLGGPPRDVLERQAAAMRAALA